MHQNALENWISVMHQKNVKNINNVVLYILLCCFRNCFRKIL